jgi:hypothetical protein
MAAPAPVAVIPDAARTLGGTPVEEMPPGVAPAGMAAAPPLPLADTVGADGVGGATGDRGKSEPNAARFCGGGAANIGPGDAWDAAGAGGGVWLTMGTLGAAGGGAEAGMDAGLTSVTAGGGVGVCGTAGGSGLPAPDARPLVNPCERSWAADVGVGRLAAGVVGVAGMLDVLGMEGIPAGRNALPPVPDIPETGLIGAETAGVGLDGGAGNGGGPLGR